MTTNKPIATLEHRPNGCVVLTPVVPEVRDLLRYPVIEFEPGGPLGHQMGVVDSDWLVPTRVRRRWIESEERADICDVQIVPQGLVSQVAEVLEKLGYRVEISDVREDSPRWVRREDWKMFVPREHRAAVEAVGEHRSLRVIGFDADRVADTIAGVARAYPEAKIAVAVPTYKLLWRTHERLHTRLGEPLGLYTAKKKTFGRVSVGMVGQLPRGRGEWDVLVLPFAEQTVSDTALYVVISEQYRRVLSFTPLRETGDEDLNQRFLVIAGHTWPEEEEPVPVTAVILSTRGTRPGEMTDAFEQKKELYWHNARRNRRIAEVAKGMVRAKTKPIRAIIGSEHEPLVRHVATAAKSGVVVLVETPVHARELAKLLPGWAMWTANDLDPQDPKAGCGIVATERALRVFGFATGVMIRATGTRWGLPKTNWPLRGWVESAVLIDFADDFHPLAHNNAISRIEDYESAGMTLSTPDVGATNNNGATGASG